MSFNAKFPLTSCIIRSVRDLTLYLNNLPHHPERRSTDAHPFPLVETHAPSVRSFLRLLTLLSGLFSHTFEFCSQSHWHEKDVVIRIIFVVRKLVAVGMLRGRIMQDPALPLFSEAASCTAVRCCSELRTLRRLGG